MVLPNEPITQDVYLKYPSTPILRLPDDVTSLIFTICTLADQAIDPDKLSATVGLFDTPRSASPTTIAQVCSAWRGLTLSTPLIWANITVDFEGPATPEHCLRRLEAHLARAGGCPLSLHLALPHATQEQSFESRACARRALAAALGAAGRWREFVLLASPDQAAEFFRASNQSAAVTLRLERLSVTASTPQRAHTPFPLGLHAPSLRRLALENIETSVRGVDWAALTHLRLFRSWNLAPQLRPTLEVLAQCRNLEECALSIDHVSSDQNGGAGAEGPLIRLKKLRSLLLTNKLNGFGIDLLLPLLRLPALNELHVHFENDLAEPAWRDGFLAFLDQNGRGLRKFTMAPFDMSDGELVACLRSVPALTHLVIGARSPWEPHSDDALGALIGGLCPQLESLEFFSSSRSQITHLVAVTFINIRRAAHSPLTRAEFALSYYLPEQDVALLKDWAQQCREESRLTVDFNILGQRLEEYVPNSADSVASLPQYDE